MADVQIDNGHFTQLANVLLEKVSSAKLNGCQHAIILQIWRYTYGFKRKEHELSAGFLAKATGYNQRQVQRDLIVLVNRNIITQRSISGISRILSFNKDYESWSTYGELADGEKADGESTDGEKAVPPTANKTGVTYGELADQEIKSFKQISKQNTDTTKPPEIVLQDEFCRTHEKGEWTLKPTEYQSMQKITSIDIPLDFILKTMNQIHEHKKLKNEKVTSFNFYYESIIEAWNSKKGVIPIERSDQGNTGVYGKSATPLTDLYAVSG